ncbi:MAG: J domain-containing protein [Desulfobaccales bacterium]|nr:J domain-containing protein [Desulfobaccales bacterium]
MSALNYYQILGISPRAGWQEIRRRYRALAWEYHPDRNPDDPEAADRFRLVAEAYEAIQGTRGSRACQAAQNYRQPRFYGDEDFFEEFFGICRPGAALQQSPGPAFRYDLQVTFAAAIRGMVTVIQVPRTSSCGHCRGTGLAPGSGYQSCPDCQGRGRRFGGPGLLRFGPVCDRCRGRGQIVAQACGYCDGQGYYGALRQYRLQIPPGTRDGACLRIPGEGGEGFYNGPPGDLEVVIQVEPHEFFTRVGNDLYCQVKISFAEAALGGPIRIPTLEGYQTLDLPRGTQTGRIFRFPGAGAPAGPHRPASDQVMEVVVTTPEYLSPRQKEILEEMARLDQAGNE